MQITVTGNHIEITPALHDRVTKKFKKISRHSDQLTSASVVLNSEHGRHMAEAKLSLRGTNLHVKTEGHDMYASIDALVEKLDRQVKKHNEKIHDHKQSSGGLKQAPLIEQDPDE